MTHGVGAGVGDRAGSAPPARRSARSADRPRCGTTPRSARNPPAPCADASRRTRGPTRRRRGPTSGRSAARPRSSAIGLGRLLRRRAVPLRVADLLQPRVDRPRSRPSAASSGSAVCRARSSGDTSTSSKTSLRQPLGERARPGAAPLGQRRIDDVQPTAHPLRFPVAHEHDLHPPDRTDRRPHRPTRFGPRGGRNRSGAIAPIACPHVRSGVPARLVPGPDGAVRVPVPQRDGVDRRRRHERPAVRRSARHRCCGRRSRARRRTGGAPRRIRSARWPR